MHNEYKFRITNHYHLTPADTAEINADSGKDWSNAYTHYKKNIKDHLYREQKGRCAFCRCIIHRGTADLTLEHIASKEKYGQYRSHPDNLLVACIKCNRPKGDKETFSNPMTSAANFPSHSEDFIIINAYYDNYEDYIDFIDDLIIQMKPGTGIKGQNTIDFYDLARPELAESRAYELGLSKDNVITRLVQQMREMHDDSEIQNQIAKIIQLISSNPF